MQSRILVEAVDLGIPESEKDHHGSGSFANRYGVPASDYGGPPHRNADAPGAAHWRDFAHWALLGFRVRPEHVAKPLAVSLLIRSYRVGDPPDPAPTKVLLVDGAGTREIGSSIVPVDGSWHLFEAESDEGVRGQDFFVKIDDAANLHGDAAHYGKSLSFVRIHRSGG